MFIPSLQKNVLLTDENLSLQERDELLVLVKKADFFHLPSFFSPSSQAADYYHYTLTIERDSAYHSVQFTDITQNTDLQSLRKYIQAKGK